MKPLILSNIATPCSHCPGTARSIEPTTKAAVCGPGCAQKALRQYYLVRDLAEQVQESSDPVRGRGWPTTFNGVSID